MPRRAVARIDVGAIARNCGRLAGLASLCAVVKADGYGHGAAAAARAALAGGAARLAVATADEAAELRAAGVGGPLLGMGALSGSGLAGAVAGGAGGGTWGGGFVAGPGRAGGPGGGRQPPPRRGGARPARPPGG